MRFALDARPAPLARAPRRAARRFAAVWPVAAVLVATTALNIIQGHSSTPTDVYVDPELARPVGQALSLAALALSAAAFVRRAWARRPWPASLPVLAAFYGALLLSDAFGAHGRLAVSPGLLATAAATAAILARGDDERTVTAGVRDVLLTAVAANALSALFLPGFALQSGYDGPFELRLHGLANQANSLAPYTVLLLVTLLLRPYRRRRLTFAAAALALGVLALTQSKTTVALLGVLALFALPLAARRLPLHARWGLALVLTPILTLAVGLAVASSGTLEALLSDDGVTTLSGRAAVWSATLDAWAQNRTFGFGYSALWNDDMGQAFARREGWQPRYAHNQALQTLGQAGVVGLAALAALLATLLARAARGPLGPLLAGTVVTFFVLRGVSEVPLGNGLFTDNTALQLMVMLLVLSPSAPGSPPGPFSVFPRPSQERDA